MLTSSAQLIFCVNGIVHQLAVDQAASLEAGIDAIIEVEKKQSELHVVYPQPSLELIFSRGPREGAQLPTSDAARRCTARPGIMCRELIFGVLQGVRDA